MNWNRNSPHRGHAWLELDAKSDHGQRLLHDLFRAFYPAGGVSIYHGCPEFFLGLEGPATLHYQPERRIGFVEQRASSGAALVTGLYASWEDARDLLCLETGILQSGKRVEFLLPLRREVFASLAGQCRIFQQLSLVQESAHYWLNLDGFTAALGLSARLRRTYRRTAPWVHGFELLPTADADLAPMLQQARTNLFRTGHLVPSLRCLEAPLRSRREGPRYHLARVTGAWEGQRFYAEIIVAVYETPDGPVAKSLHEVDNRKTLAAKWISPGTVATLEVIRWLQRQGVCAYNLGSYGPACRALSEYKSQFRGGAVVEYGLYAGELAGEARTATRESSATHPCAGAI